ncbi:Reticulon-4-interacting protein 1, mitochondrial [Strongyloides ratti]|uniref:Reticulon-4-interacting protein 1, mitochondrial n=1 Tax=Strongyloides ratti TaxID=34506 RepID=A0A090LJF9_STRRB|nr:Reticulon-4-interacting protein 1, mitochondrial [Strongyloides ratti]CEF67675.1 Reticulon-4-interacting protein 1, mitochondrial [Strongyloides ratti]
MKAWEITKFGKALSLTNRQIPIIRAGNEILVKVKAASVNPIDVRMTEGYGNELLSKWRQLHEMSFTPFNRLPLIAGRDLSGEIVEVGNNVTEFKVGDEIIATVPDTTNAVKKPSNVSHVEGVALAYTTATAWNSLCCVGRLNSENAKYNRVLIHGGSGGVGISAIQLLKALNIEKVVATASEANLDIIKNLGDEGPFDIILSCVDTELSRWSDKCMGIWRNCIHLSLVSPMLRDSDRYGIPLGLLSTGFKYFERSFNSLKNGRWYSYSFFMPNKECMNFYGNALESGKMKPIIEEEMSFMDMPKAYEKVGKLHGRGKTVVNFEL